MTEKINCGNKYTGIMLEGATEVSLFAEYNMLYKAKEGRGEWVCAECTAHNHLRRGGLSFFEAQSLEELLLHVDGGELCVPNPTQGVVCSRGKLKVQ